MPTLEASMASPLPKLIFFVESQDDTFNCLFTLILTLVLKQHEHANTSQTCKVISIRKNW